MIAKISNWSSGRELIRNLFGPGMVHEHLDPRVLTSGVVMGEEVGRALNTGELADLGASLDADEDCWGTSPAGGHIWHLSLSLAQQDRQLTDDQWAAIHIAASVVRLDGSRVNIWQDRKTLSRVCNECEHTYDLTVVKGRQGKKTSGSSGVTAVADRGPDDEDAKDPS